MQKQEFVVNLGDTSFVLRLNSPQKGRFSWDTQRHCNADYELHMILSGNCVMSVEDQEYALSAGNAIVILPGHYHQPLSISNAFQKLSVSFFPFSGKVKESIHDTGAFSVVSLSDAMLQLAFQIIEESAKGLPFQRDLTGAMLTQLMVYMLRKLSVPESANAPELSNNWRIDVIDNFFSEDLTYGTQMQLAEQLHLSRRQLSRVMQTHYGTSFREKLQSSRMNRAAWLLRTTDLTIAQVYSDVGYDSEAAFYQNFKSFFGMTPRQYRKKHKGQDEK